MIVLLVSASLGVQIVAALVAGLHFKIAPSLGTICQFAALTIMGVRRFTALQDLLIYPDATTPIDFYDKGVVPLVISILWLFAVSAKLYQYQKIIEKVRSICGIRD